MNRNSSAASLSNAGLYAAYDHAGQKSLDKNTASATSTALGTAERPAPDFQLSRQVAVLKAAERQIHNDSYARHPRRPVIKFVVKASRRNALSQMAESYGSVQRPNIAHTAMGTRSLAKLSHVAATSDERLLPRAIAQESNLVLRGVDSAPRLGASPS